MDNKQGITVRNRIKAVLADHDKKSGWLAEQLGKSPNTVSRWCSNKTQPSLAQLGEIASVLNVEVGTLITTVEYKE